jgi:multidrug efflux pump subunit AcrB
MVAIPLSIMTSIAVLAALGQTINTMTLGGLALAVGILVDDSTVTIENTHRLLEEGTEFEEAVLEGAAGIAVPTLISTLAICSVFVSVFFLQGAAPSLHAASDGGGVCHARLLWHFAHAHAHHDRSAVAQGA